ncbi:capsule assembly Wzi family protein [Autumnicola psychrophila]|uniref:Capsule assembly Wzi family protein n=1 Tax=Autumnicola psychrophila TaxID=3075592 RepID=A0ABU3DQR0_9FLAO|nr:capsule assembly Wzi family protein [Zunongwangia sp. F225]MDT0686050.1 capsule assembly Wzi family protein [Zunongwangia sp. F225]
MKFHNYLWVVLIWMNLSGYSQFSDSLNVIIGTTGSVASEEFQPLWLVANKWGTIEDKKADLSSRIRISNSHIFTNFSNNNSEIKKPQLTLNYGIDIYNNDQFNYTFIQEGFAELSYAQWHISGGRFENVIGEVHPELSSGSLGGISRNALPIPKISAFNSDYISIPFTDGWLQFKGLFSHGWLGDNRLLEEAYLHEKALYGRIGKRKFKLYGGIQHYGIWGGQNSKYQLDRSFDGFLDVVFFKEANDGSVGQDFKPNRAGYQRGSADLGLTYNAEKVTLNIYHQTPIENHTSITFQNKDRLVGISLDWVDQDKFWQSLLFEFLYTKQMSDYEGNPEAYYYYENGVYQTGWDYMGRVIGTPLIINRTRGSKYFEGLEPPVWDGGQTYPLNYNMPGNRLIAGHFGALFRPFKKINCKTLLTYSRNYGNGDSVEFFNPEKNQFYSLQEISYSLRSNLKLVTSLAYDLGDIYSNFGGMLELQWNLR